KKSLSKMAEDHKTYIDQHEFFDSMDKTFNEITEKL
ncbi:ParA family protein, partial [Lactobacillus delbrueckii subsp. lactis]